jgi:VIT1/CCC1 family predicted Fe2+/Mn2+ transporter
MKVLIPSFSITAEASPMALRLKFWRKEVEDVTGEQHKQPGLISDFILGSQDGIVNVLGVILGVAVASQDFRIILAGGLAATFAESISMGAVAYTSTMARREFYLAEYEREKREMEEVPEQEKEEVRKILERWGVPSQELEDILVHITMKPKAWLDIMMAHELNLSPVDEKQAGKSAMLVGVAAIVGSLIPLLPFIFAGNAILMGIVGSLILSALTLFLIGWYKAKLTVGRPHRSGLQMLIIGISSALAGFGVAFLVSGGKGL